MSKQSRALPFAASVLSDARPAVERGVSVRFRVDTGVPLPHEQATGMSQPSQEPAPSPASATAQTTAPTQSARSSARPLEPDVVHAPSPPSTPRSAHETKHTQIERTIHHPDAVASSASPVASPGKDVESAYLQPTTEAPESDSAPWAHAEPASAATPPRTAAPPPSRLDGTAADPRAQPSDIRQTTPIEPPAGIADAIPANTEVRTAESPLTATRPQPSPQDVTATEPSEPGEGAVTLPDPAEPARHEQRAINVAQTNSAPEDPQHRQAPSVPERPYRLPVAAQTPQARSRVAPPPAEAAGVRIGTLDIRVEAPERPAPPVATKPGREASVASRRYIRRA